MKYLCLAFLIGLAGVAYAANTGTSPPVDLPITITGSSSTACANGGNIPTASIPSQATAAGFTTCVANWDFTGATSSFYQTGSNWLDCAGAAAPQLWNISNFGIDNPAHCSDYTIINDGGTNALHMAYTQADFDNNNNQLVLQSTPQSRDGTGTLIPQFHYVEARVRTNSSSISNNPSGELFNIWSYSGVGSAPAVEWDFIEYYSTSYGINGWSPGGTGFIGTLPGGIDGLSYFTIGALTTTPDGVNYTTCGYVNNVQYNCTHGTWAANGGAQCNVASCINVPIELLITIGNGKGNQVRPHGDMEIWVQWWRVYSCANWNAGPVSTRGANCS